MEQLIGMMMNDYDDYGMMIDWLMSKNEMMMNEIKQMREEERNNWEQIKDSKERMTSSEQQFKDWSASGVTTQFDNNHQLLLEKIIYSIF